MAEIIATLLGTFMGGLIAIFGSTITNILDSNKALNQLKIEKLEELILLIEKFVLYHDELRNYYFFKETDPGTNSPFPMITSITSVYFYELNSQILKLEEASNKLNSFYLKVAERILETEKQQKTWIPHGEWNDKWLTEWSKINQEFLLIKRELIEECSTLASKYKQFNISLPQVLSSLFKKAN